VSPTLVAVIGLSAVTMMVKAAGSLAPRIPDAIAKRSAGLAPALLAGLIVSDVAGADGLPDVDAKLAVVAVALLLAGRRLPLAVTVIAGAATAAALRALA
jgi:hypothetical protein